MLKYGKSYTVTPRTGVSDIYRSGKLVGRHPEVGYRVVVVGVCSAIAGTELAAHALAEVYKNVVHERRLWVLTEAEVDEHLRVLSDNQAELMKAFPYSEHEKASVDAHYEEYASVTAAGEHEIRQRLMNVWTLSYVSEPRGRPRPEKFPGTEEEHETSNSMRP